MKRKPDVKLDREEKELLRSVERGEWRTIPDFEREKERYRRMAIATLRKDKRINIRIAEMDLLLLQKRALEEGLPYQSLISSVLHKYVSGRLRESAAK
jgi:predicted DNA binding CopG/RHH family protein